MKLTRYFLFRAELATLLVGLSSLTLFAASMPAMHAAQRVVDLLLGAGFVMALVGLLLANVRWLRLFLHSRLLARSELELTLPSDKIVALSSPLNAKSSLVIFFQNASPQLLSGDITLCASNGWKRPAFSLSQMEPYERLLYKKNKTWPRSTGRDYYPLLIEHLDIEGASGAVSISMKLKWNFEGEYLEKLIPAGRLLKVEVWLLGEKGTRK